ncbi:hypothetical protein [Methylomicrobium sp. Wu6]|uniref:hypothetical protein n=1 Tax=Methylomicrobium sp. Wu6 TaxID=3107928 RepID=UPI002DD69FA4|nr:hypothetical protein [Methylomicrobium sp. Wu6]MEC4747715.1 hypothetical protein [Methylomicrobium sp. Wu6]
MGKVRTQLDEIRGAQLEAIAAHHGFDSVATYLDNHIAAEWRRLHPETFPELPGFEINGSLNERGEPIVTFAFNGAVPVVLDAIHADYLANGIDWVLDDQQKSFFIVCMIDDSILCFDKRGNGFRLMIKWSSGEWKRGLSRSIAEDLRNIFRKEAHKAVNLSKSIA